METTEIKNENNSLSEIDTQNAINAQENAQKQEVPFLDYEKFSLEELFKELKNIFETYEIQAITKHCQAIKIEFDQKYKELFQQKKEEFLQNEESEDKDFHFEFPLKKDFYALLKEIKNKRDQYYKVLEEKLQSNLKKKQEIISEIKDLILMVESNGISEAFFRKFKELREEFIGQGAVPKEFYNDIWQNFNYQCDRFYDYLSLHKELREMDFKRNLQEKQNLIEKAKDLLKEPYSVKIFQELQQLHRIWKEQTGSVDKEHRETIWEEFKKVSDDILNKKDEFEKAQQEIFNKNAEEKSLIISKLEEILKEDFSKNQVQKISSDFEALCQDYLKIGRVPDDKEEEFWSIFRKTRSDFYKKRNEFYKNQTSILKENLKKKQELLEIALQNKDSENWAEATTLFQKIQADWKKIGQVPQKNSQTIWEEFKKVCNEYFDRLNAHRESQRNQDKEIIVKKEEILNTLKEFNLSGNFNADLQSVKDFITQWNSLPKLFQKNPLDLKFNKIIDSLFKKLDVDKQKSELLKYSEKIEKIANSDNKNAILNEIIFVRKKIDAINAEILQMENNLLFFGKGNDKNPLVKEVVKRIEAEKNNLNTWKLKLKELNALVK